MSTIKVFGLTFLILFAIFTIGGLIVISPIMIYSAYGQQKTTTTTPATTTQTLTPTPVPTPTPTAPNPNFQYLPQKAAVTVYTPEIGVPVNPAQLQSVPQVIPVQQQPVQSGVLGIPGLDAAAVVGLIGLAVRSELKGKTISDVVKRIAGTQVKIVEANEEHLGLTMNNMPDKGNEIVNMPNIKQEHIKEIKEEALKNAEKA